MSIKGTLETFNLLDLIQMLSFNQKVGTLVLETASGPRTLFVESGTFGFVQGDPLPSRALARVLRRSDFVPADRLERGLSITANSGRFLGDALQELGVLDQRSRTETWVEGVHELFFDLLQTPITRFEFVEGKCLAPNGEPGAAIQPLCAVDALLLDLTRKIDEWAVLRREIPTEEEVYEVTGVMPDLSDPERVPELAAARALPLIDGRSTLASIVEASDCDRFSVVKLAAHLQEQGTIRPVSTEDLLARAEDLLAHGASSEAVPLLRRAVDRGDGPAKVRLRLADALSARGDGHAAAAELDTYAATSESTDPAGTFDALHRALRARKGDAATAARLCDHWLRNATRLRSRAHDAQEALHALIHAASTGGKPLEAASRLAAFLQQGEADGEDRLVLADLYAAGGHPVEAAEALIVRADELARAGRSTPARELYRRALAYDASRVDARRRLADIEGAARRRAHRRRMVLLTCLLALVIGTAGAVYLVYDGRTAKVVDAAVHQAEDGSRHADAEEAKAMAAWASAVAQARTAAVDDGSLPGAAAELRAAYARIAGKLKSTVAAARGDVDREGAAHRADPGIDRLRALEAAASALVAKAGQAIGAVGVRAQAALEEGERAFEGGRFRDARPLLLEAQRLSFEDPSRAARAGQRLDQVDSYVAAFQKAREAFDAAAAGSDTDEAWRIGCRLLATFLDSDLTREVLLPVPVTTDPAGAVVRVGGDGATLTAPAVLRYSPFGSTDLLLRAPGRSPAKVTLPTYAEIRDGSRRGFGLPPVRVSRTLYEGARWTAKPASAGPFALPEGAWVVAPDGRRVLSMRASDGALSEARGLPAFGDVVRLAGKVGGGLWFLLGQRTFAYVPDGEAPSWQYQTKGRLGHGPALANGLVILVDETGLVTAVDAVTGTASWRRQLGSAPAQAPFTSAGSIVVTTLGGEVVLLTPLNGELRLLQAPTPGSPAFAVPYRDGILVLGGAAPGMQWRPPNRDAVELGAAKPDISMAPVEAPDGIAWVESDGRVRWLSKKAGAKPVDLTAAGTAALRPTVVEGKCYVVGKDGLLRAVRTDQPETLVWKTTLPAPALGAAVAMGEVLVVRTETGLVAYDR